MAFEFHQGHHKSEKKAVFFDVDGTLWDFHNYIPESTKTAIRQLKEHGHYVFINSGRVRAFIHDPGLLNLDFDGIVSGCGTCVEYHHQRLFYKCLEPELLEFTQKTTTELGFRNIMEGFDYLYLEHEDFDGDTYGDKVFSEVPDRVRSIREEWGHWEASKLSSMVLGDMAAGEKKLAEYYDFIVHNERICEILPKGYHKGTGILKVCELLDLDPANTYAFGDSNNDLDMFRGAGISVAMGNGTPEARSTATMVTDSLMEDGVYKACRKLELI